MNENEEHLIESAILASTRAYAPYSKFHVGAAILTSDGSIVLGCNVENASYGLTNCAERTAIFSAFAQGKLGFVKMALFTDTVNFTPPCGACRQVLNEFSPDMPIILVNKERKQKLTSVKELLPLAFGDAQLFGK